MALLRRMHVPGHLAAPWHALHVPVMLAGVLTAGFAITGAVAAALPMASLVAPAFSPSMARVTSVVRQHVNEWQPAVDPLLIMDNGLQAKASNVNGIEIGGTRYYYRVRNSVSFDPVSLGTAQAARVVAVLDQGTHWETEIYKLD